MRDHPIPSVTEPMQYRAIGLVRGVYQPEDDEKFTRGKLIDSSGEQIDSVVLGRVITLMKRHLKVAEPHLWVVYPRCRELGHLHLQITGIWEPSTLLRNSLTEKNNVEGKFESKVDAFDQLPEGDDYFSIRGDLIYTNPENNEIVIKIRQRARSKLKKTVPFKLILEGQIPIEHLRNFVSLNVRRKANNLVVEDFEVIGPIQKKNFKKRENKIL